MRTDAVTIRQVAQEAGVSIATVSRVVNNHPAVHPDVKKQVEIVIERLGYRPNRAAQTMRTRSSSTIACAIRDISTQEFGAFIRSAEAVVRQLGYTFILTTTDRRAGMEVDLIRHLSQRGVDGLLLTKTRDHDPELEEELKKAPFPVVFIDREVSPSANAVVIDHRNGITNAVNFLVSLGHQHISLITGPVAVRSGRERVQAYEAALKQHGIEVNPGLVVAQSFDTSECFRHASLVLDHSPRPTAMIAGGMAILPAILRAIKLRKLEIGKDISVIAGVDSDLAELATPAISTIRWDIGAWGRTCAQLLLDQIASPTTPLGRQIILPTELIIRASCRPPTE